MYQKSKSIRIKQYCGVDQMLDRWWMPNKCSLSSQDLSFGDLSPGSTLPLPHFRNELELEDLLIDSIAWIPLCPRTPSTLP